MKTIKTSRSMSIAKRRSGERGFSLVEVMIALMITAFGLLSAGQLIFIAASSESLARSKGTAALVARNMLETLSDIYSVDRSNAQVVPGDHGPEEIEIVNPDTADVLNHFRMTWAVENVQDPRPDVILNARSIRITVTPIRPGNFLNYKPPFNKIMNIATVISPEIQ